ncbi:MAG: hypothetical protein IKT86_03715 [Bacteroidaceae bacterium]|nr:hypothetical protein [Bacteroidaceae bacterium]
MKHKALFHKTLTTALLGLCTMLTAHAQSDTDRYMLTPDYMQQVFSDIISTECSIVHYSDGGGSYDGYSRNNKFFGWGSYQTENGNRWIGQWNNGKCIFGILIKGDVCRVGSDTQHVNYSLKEGIITSYVKNNEKFPVSAEEAQQSPYRFACLHYEGGDLYIGETKNGLRHGQGIYHWANGNYWYGTFSDNYRQGYGALFREDGHIDYGLWLGNDKQ